MIMVDPKRLELGMYEEIPHLLTPVVVDPKLAANALRWAVREMEERYKTLAAVGVRNIDQYNRNIRAMIEENNGTGDRRQGRRDQDPSLHRRADRRAGGPDDGGGQRSRRVDLPARADGARGRDPPDPGDAAAVGRRHHRVDQGEPPGAYLVPRVVEDRLADHLDSNGAEQLLGKGDMLYLPPASSRHLRLHGPYISEQESARLASFLRKQGKPTYDVSITEDDKKAGPDSGFEKDDLYDEAARIVVTSGQASISYLQRRLRIGFSRAARLVDMMEADGLVSRRRRQGARGAGEEGLLRRGRRPGQVSRHAQDPRHQSRSPLPASRSPRRAGADRRGRYTRALGAESCSATTSAAHAQAVRTVASSYETVVHRHPGERLLGQCAVARRQPRAARV